MDKQAIKDFLKVFELQDKFHIPDNGWFNINCLFARWTHQAGKLDETPSASVLVNPEGKSSYRCWACNTKGSILGILHQLKEYDPRAYQALEIARKFDSDSDHTIYEKISSRNQKGLELFDSWYGYEEIPAAKKEIDNEVWSDSELEAFNITSEKRKELSSILELSQYLLLDWEIGYDKYNGRITFPIRRFGDCGLVSIVGRQMSNGAYKNYLGLDKKYLYGEHRLQSNEKTPIIVVEGMRDVIHVSQLEEFDVVGTMGVSYTKGQVQRLVDLNRPIILLGDGDVYGHKFNQDLYKDLCPYLNVTPVFLPITEEKLDPQKLNREELLKWIGSHA